jgi:hypothetical protein
MEKEKKEQQYYHGLPVDSDEEILTIMWLEELMQAGYVAKVQRADPFVITEPYVNTYNAQVELKTKTKTVEKSQVILKGHVYTPEFKVTLTRAGIELLSWRNHTTPQSSYSEVNSKFDKLFIARYEDPESVVYIEVKPGFDQNNMTRLFTINQKLVWDKYGIFVNLIQPEELCKKTFTPNDWLITKTGKKRIIHWDIRSLDDYLLILKDKKE